MQRHTARSKRGTACFRAAEPARRGGGPGARTRPRARTRARCGRGASRGRTWPATGRFSEACDGVRKRAAEIEPVNDYADFRARPGAACAAATGSGAPTRLKLAVAMRTRPRADYRAALARRRRRRRKRARVSRRGADTRMVEAWACLARRSWRATSTASIWRGDEPMRARGRGASPGAAPGLRVGVRVQQLQLTRRRSTWWPKARPDGRANAPRPKTSSPAPPPPRGCFRAIIWPPARARSPARGPGVREALAAEGLSRGRRRPRRGGARRRVPPRVRLRRLSDRASAAVRRRPVAAPPTSMRPIPCPAGWSQRRRGSRWRRSPPPPAVIAGGVAGKLGARRRSVSGYPRRASAPTGVVVGDRPSTDTALANALQWLLALVPGADAVVAPSGGEAIPDPAPPSV